MNDLQNFASELQQLMGRPSMLRPFVCEGSPLTCAAFIVGFNAATDVTADFWSHWRDGYGFDKAAWYVDYLSARAAKPLKPGRTRRLAMSTTRKRIELVIKAAAPVRCLETNIYSTPSASASELSSDLRSTAVFDFLLKRIKPRVILAHGEDAVAYMRRRNTTALLIESPHFASRGGFNDAASAERGIAISEAVGAR